MFIRYKKKFSNNTFVYDSGRRRSLKEKIRISIVNLTTLHSNGTYTTKYFFTIINWCRRSRRFLKEVLKRVLIMAMHGSF
jgi:hypothetical protein